VTDGAPVGIVGAGLIGTSIGLALARRGERTLLHDADPAKAGRIVTYDAAGGRYDELLGYHAIGSGSVFAKSALKKRHDPNADLASAVRTAVESLYDAADDDTATGGPDLTRRIFPVVASITGPDGAVRRPEEEIEAIVRDMVVGRTENPGG